MCAAAVAAYPGVSAARLPWLHAGIAIAGFAFLAAGLALRRSQFLAWALALLGANYAVWLALGTHVLDQRIPVVGAGLLLTAELSFDSLEPEVGRRVDPTTLLARAIVIVIVVFGAVGAGALVLAVASVPLNGGVAVTAVGAVAAVLVLVMIRRLAHERR